MSLHLTGGVWKMEKLAGYSHEGKTIGVDFQIIAPFTYF